MKPKIAVYDIETSPNLVYSWGLYKQNISPNMIVRNWTIMSLCYKWIGKDKLHYYDARRNPDDDTDLAQRAWDLFDQADILVGQNSKAFDTPKINARLIEHGLPPPSPYKQIDTKAEAAKIAAFTSNKLEWLGPHIAGADKSNHPEFPGFTLWSECLLGNPRAWEVMETYNKIDVETTERLYLNLRPWIPGHPNLAVYDDSEDLRCPKCDSRRVQRRGFDFTQTGKYQRYVCTDCGGWSRTRYTENTLAKRQSLLGN